MSNGNTRAFHLHRKIQSKEAASSDFNFYTGEKHEHQKHFCLPLSVWSVGYRMESTLNEYSYSGYSRISGSADRIFQANATCRR